VFPVRAVTRYADFGILQIFQRENLLVSQRENLLDPFNTGTVEVHKVVEGIVFGRGADNWGGVLPSTTDYIYGKPKDKTGVIMVDLHIPNTTKVLGFLTAHIIDPDLPNHPLKLCSA
jgi:hypothetical protein